MSEALAIPATTLVLKLLIEKRLKIAYGALSPPQVSVVPPPLRQYSAGATGANTPPELPGLTLYLHHITPNTAWRSMFDPHIDSSGQRVAIAPVVLDLSYLVTAQGAGLEREVLIGIAVSALNRNAVLPRPMISQLLGTIAVPPMPTAITDLLPTAPLADATKQLESITITQLSLDIDMSTKIWSALQSPLRPSAYFTVTTLFLNVDETFPDPLPVNDVRLGVWPNPIPTSSQPMEDVGDVTQGL